MAPPRPGSHDPVGRRPLSFFWTCLEGGSTAGPALTVPSVVGLYLACTSATMRLMVYDNLMTTLTENTELKRLKAQLVRKSVRTRDRSFFLIESSMGFPYFIDATDIESTERWAMEERCAVRGELWECSEEALRSLDFFNGVPFVHQRKLVALQGEQEPAFVYMLKETNTIAAVSADRRKYLSVQPLGDWRAYLPASSETALAAAHAALPQTRASMLLPGPHAVFSYGSNGLQQLRQRLKNPTLQFKPAILPNSLRIFCGASKSWEGGGAASIVPMPGWEVKGNIAYLTDDELRLLDRFEGTPRDEPYATTTTRYRRQDVHVLCEIDNQIQTIDAIVYVKNEPKWVKAPSEAYLAACQKNIDVFWPSECVEVRDWRGLLRGGTGTRLHSSPTPHPLKMPGTATGRAKRCQPEVIESNPLLLLQQMQQSDSRRHVETHQPSKRRKKAPIVAAATALTEATAAAITSVTLVAAGAGSCTEVTDAIAAASASVASVEGAIANASASSLAPTMPTMLEGSPIATAAEAAAVAALDHTTAAAFTTSQSLVAAAAALSEATVAIGMPVAGNDPPIVPTSDEGSDTVIAMGKVAATPKIPNSAAEPAAAAMGSPARMRLDATVAAALASEAASAAAMDAMVAAKVAVAAEEAADKARQEAMAKAAQAITAAATAQEKVAEALAAATIATDKVHDLMQGTMGML